MSRHDRYIHHILTEIEAGRPITQRRLAKELDVALGLTNLLIRRLVGRGYVKMMRIGPRQARYLLTPAGFLEKARVTRAFFDNTVHLYTETRGQIQRSLERLSSEWPAHNGEAVDKRIVFFGAGDVAEIAYVSLQNTDLRLIGVVDDTREKPFFGLPVCRPEQMHGCTLNGEPFHRLVVMSFRRATSIRRRLGEIGFPQERAFWL